MYNEQKQIELFNKCLKVLYSVCPRRNLRKGLELGKDRFLVAINTCPAACKYAELFYKNKNIDKVRRIYIKKVTKDISDFLLSQYHRDIYMFLDKKFIRVD